MRVVFIAAFIAGCVKSASQYCDTAFVCPAADRCVVVDTIQTCVTLSELAACEGRADGDTCTVEGTNYKCHDGACVTLCGNSIMDESEGEACDDDNRLAGDGCSPTCHIEGCGGAELDLALGEACDDGDRVDGDGCSSMCEIESTQWLQIAPSTVDGRAGMAVAFDGTTVFGFGGIGVDGPIADTVEGTPSGGLFVVTTTTTPPARAGHSIAYDSKRKRFIMFGGLDATGTALADTWAWDGTTWTDLTSSVAPPARWGTQIAYDVGHDRVVLHGGTEQQGGANGPMNDTWVFDGATWSEVSPTNVPPPSYFPSLVYNAAASSILLCVVYGASGMYQWNGTNWQSLGTSCPGTTHPVELTYDPANDRVVAFNGETGQFHTWNGSAWSAGTTAGSTQNFASVTYDGNGILAFGGTQSTTTADLRNGPYASGVHWDGTSASPVALTTPRVAPLGAPGSAFAFDHVQGFGVLVGVSMATDPNETWLWDRNGWHRSSGTTMPLRRFDAGLAVDTSRGAFVMFGGEGWDGSGKPVIHGDTWEFTASGGWAQKSTTGVGARSGTAVAYDAKRGQTILFGGKTSSGTPPLADTWAWDGTTWTQLLPAISPPGRSNAAIAYDPVRERIVMFGGSTTATSIAGDTWLWDGTSWAQAPSQESPPPPRAATQLVWDPLRRVITMYGGRSPGGGSLADVWDWDGTEWTKRFEDNSFGRAQHVMFFDSIRDALVAFGGSTYFATLDRRATYELSSATGAPRELCERSEDGDGDGLAGCADHDCWGRCTPSCPPGSACDTSKPHCGDDVCNDTLEDILICPGDCP